MALIGVSGRRWAAHRVQGLPANFASTHVDLVLADYPRAVAAAGALPVSVPFEADPDAVMARLDGLVLTGGSDVDPRRYGASPGANLGEVEPDRDAYELALYHAALRAGRPVLAVCRGAQIANVAHGGTLVADLSAAQGCGHPAWSFPRDALLHTVELTVGSLVARVHGATSVMVNSLHHQSVDRPGSGVCVTGRAPDGVVEAFEVDGARVLAVQWHPELYTAQPDPCFRWLAEEASPRGAV